MKTAVYQAKHQGAKWTCWIWITPDAQLRPLSSLQCPHGCAGTDEFPPLACLLPFCSWEMGLSWQVISPLPQTTEWVAKSHCINQLWLGCSFSQSIQGNFTWMSVCLCSPFTSTNWRYRQSPPLDKGQLLCCSSVTLWDQGRIKKNPGTKTNKKLKQNSEFCSITMSLKTVIF